MNNPLSNTPGSAPQPLLYIDSNKDCSCDSASAGTGNGVDAFIELVDVPSTYLGQRGKLVAVNSTENGLVFTDNSASGWRPATRISRSDPKWTNDHTYTNADWEGSNPFVYANGNKILTPELEGFVILDGGGFTYDPTKFQFYDGEFLYVIF